MTEFRDGDNIVSTLMEHNSNHVPWHGLTTEILPRFGVNVEYRLARFDPATGALDLEHLASLVDTRTKLISVTGASNFLGSKPSLPAVRRIADGSGYTQPDGEPGSLLLVDGAQLVPSTAVDVQALDVDYLSFSFHKVLAPFGVGVLYAKQRHLERSLPFLYGGDMIAEGRVAEHHVEYNDLPWKYAAGTPNILGTILSAEALRLMLDLAIEPQRRRFFRTGRPIPSQVVGDAMDRIGRHTRMLTARALDLLSDIEGITIYGPGDAGKRSPLVAFNVAGLDPFDIARRLDDAGVEARAGCHCATLAHRHLNLDLQASCRLSFALYNTVEDVDVAVGAVADIVSRTRTGVRHTA
jgi:cysteine desulfurase/selenocysteine lyase